VKTYAQVIEISPGKEDVLRSLTFPGDYVAIVPWSIRAYLAGRKHLQIRKSLWGGRRALYCSSEVEQSSFVRARVVKLFIVLGVEHEAQ
jgi:hypothetical protein